MRRTTSLSPFLSALLLALLLWGPPSSVLAYSNSKTISQRSDGQRMTFTFSSLPMATGSVKVEIYLYGDYNSSSENAEVWIDNAKQSTICSSSSQCRTQCNTSATSSSGHYRTYSVGASMVNDNQQLVVIVDLSSSVNYSICSSKNARVIVKVSFTESSPQPELAFTSFSVSPLNVRKGDQTSITYRIYNKGTKATPTSFYVRFYYSEDKTFQTSDTQVYSKQINTLAARSYYPASGNDKITVTIPATANNGRRYLLGYVDYPDRIKELNEKDNLFSYPVTIGTPADLLISTWNAPASAKGAGSSVAITFQVQNKGATDAGAFDVQFFYSESSSSRGLSAIATHTVSSLKAGATSSQYTVQAKLPSDVLSGQRYLHYFIDPTNKIPESSLSNNRGHRALTISGKPDLKVSTFSASSKSVKPGGTVTVTYRVKNDGATRTQKAFALRFYFSTDAKYQASDTVLQTMAVGTLPVGGMFPTSAEGKVTLALPKTIPSGAGYLLAFADFANAISEDSETNNVSSAGVTVPEDKDGDGSTSDLDCDDNDKTIYPGAPEKCDGKDNDCDKKTDEDFADLGKSCTSGKGACQNTGKNICKSDGSGVECDAKPGQPSKEICDGKDNDCDGEIDEENVCCAEIPFGQEGSCQEAVPEGPADGGEATGEPPPDAPDPCQGVHCKADEFCRGGNCVKACGCLRCPADEKCVDGACQKDPCAQARCPSGEVCDPSTGQCIPDLCDTVTCQSGEICQDGNCVPDPCKAIRCPDKMECQDGQCVGKNCGEGSIETPSETPGDTPGEGTGESGKETGPQEGSNEPTPEAGPADQPAEAGPQDSGTTGTREVEGGGCGCGPGTTAPASLLWWLALLLLAFPRRRRRPR